MKKLLYGLVIGLALCGLAQAQKPKIVTAAQANGTYTGRSGEIKILALGGHKLKMQFDLFYEYKSPQGPSANTGTALGEADIENDVATFSPEAGENCTITIKFLAGNKIKVTQDGSDSDCGFGHNVTADGTYRKTKSGKPKFDEN